MKSVFVQHFTKGRKENTYWLLLDLRRQRENLFFSRRWRCRSGDDDGWRLLRPFVGHCKRWSRVAVVGASNDVDDEDELGDAWGQRTKYATPLSSSRLCSLLSFFSFFYLGWWDLDVQEDGYGGLEFQLGQGLGRGQQWVLTGVWVSMGLQKVRLGCAFVIPTFYFIFNGWGRGFGGCTQGICSGIGLCYMGWILLGFGCWRRHLGRRWGSRLVSMRGQWADGNMVTMKRRWLR